MAEAVTSNGPVIMLTKLALETVFNGFDTATVLGIRFTERCTSIDIYFRDIDENGSRPEGMPAACESIRVRCSGVIELGMMNRMKSEEMGLVTSYGAAFDQIWGVVLEDYVDESGSGIKELVAIWEPTDSRLRGIRIVCRDVVVTYV